VFSARFVGFDSVSELDVCIFSLFSETGQSRAFPRPPDEGRSTGASSGKLLDHLFWVSGRPVIVRGSSGRFRTKGGRPAVRPFGYWNIFMSFRSTGDRPGFVRELPDEGRSTGNRPAGYLLRNDDFGIFLRKRA